MKHYLIVGCPWDKTVHWKRYRYFQWVDVYDPSIDGIIYYDRHIPEGLNSKYPSHIKRYGWLNETRRVTTDSVYDIKTNYAEYADKFEYIFTHDHSILGFGDLMKFLPTGGNYTTVGWHDIPHENKTKLVSMISSNRTCTPGHKYRMSWVKKLQNDMDIFGRGLNAIDSKLVGLEDYMFSVAIENDQYNTYFTEKIMDCFATKTIPIYFGSPDIGEYFNSKGIITLTPEFSVNDISPELYYSKLAYVNENYERAYAMTTSEDLMFEQYLAD